MGSHLHQVGMTEARNEAQLLQHVHNVGAIPLPLVLRVYQSISHHQARINQPRPSPATAAHEQPCPVKRRAPQGVSLHRNLSGTSMNCRYKHKM